MESGLMSETCEAKYSALEHDYHFTINYSPSGIDGIEVNSVCLDEGTSWLFDEKQGVTFNAEEPFIDWKTNDDIYEWVRDSALEHWQKSIESRRDENDELKYERNLYND
jgi:hypothetical protein